MKITLSSTSLLVTIHGAPACIWEGQTESGIKVHAAIAMIAVKRDADNSQFQAELIEQPNPSADSIAAFDRRLF